MKPIPVSEFSSHVERLHADRDKLFEMEYEVSACSDYTTRNYKLWFIFVCNNVQSVSKHPQSSYSVAEIPHNKLKNRFANIFPCKPYIICLS